jgi:flavin reductase (DIM6/NTAB) family NADH-FMN oxidoreductase RutF
VSSGGELRELMRRLAAPVVVLTLELDGRRNGVTVGSFVSLSLDPPLVGVAIARTAQFHEALREVDLFGVNALAADQDGVAQHFARGVPPIVMWTGIAVRAGDGPPLLEGCLGWLVCRRVEDVPAGDHTFFVGEVLSVEHGVQGPALAHVGQTYVSL